MSDTKYRAKRKQKIGVPIIQSGRFATFVKRNHNLDWEYVDYLILAEH